MDKAKYDYHKEIIDFYAPDLIKAERLIRSIKSSKEWKRASNYFKVLYKRGYLKENPCSRNGYKIIPAEKVLDLSDVTPEQLEQIKGVLGREIL